MTGKLGSTLLLALGALLIIAGFVVKFVVVPSLAKFPDDVDSTRTYAGTVDIECDMRGTLRNFGLKVGVVSTKNYEARIRDFLPEALAGIDAAIDAGLSPVKINVVLLHGLLPGEVDDLFSLAREKPVEVRFIEQMPIGCVPSGGYLAAGAVRDRILSLPGVRVAGGTGPSAALTWETTS